MRAGSGLALAHGGSVLLTLLMCRLPASLKRSLGRERGDIPEMGQASGLWGDAGVPPTCLSFLSPPLTFREETGLGQPGARQLLLLFLPWDGACHRRDPRYSVLQEPVHSSRFAGACDSSTSFTGASSSLSQHVKLTNKSLGGQHIEWFPASQLLIR